jgi:hypothetical protein
LLDEFAKDQAREAVDQLRSGQSQPQATPPESETLEQWQQRIAAEQPAQTETPEQAQTRIAQMLERDPALLGAIQSHVGGLEMKFDADRQQMQQAVMQTLEANALQAQAAILAIPEFQGYAPNQLQTVLQTLERSNPQRAAEIKNQIQATKNVVAQHQQVIQAQQGEHS